MKLEKIAKAAALAACTAGVIIFAGMQLVSMRVQADDNESESDAQLAAIGLRIAPKFINLKGKDRTLVGLGSFIVHGQADCTAVTAPIRQTSSRYRAIPTFSPLSTTRPNSTRPRT
jgi:hypothetical protein